MLSRSSADGDVLAFIRDDPATNELMQALEPLLPMTRFNLHKRVVPQALLSLPSSPEAAWKLPLEWATARAWRLRHPTLRWRVKRARCIVLTGTDQASLLETFGTTPVVYYASDDVAVGAHGAIHREYESRIVARSSKIAVVSHALAEEFVRRYKVTADRLLVSPNAVPSALIPSTCPIRPSALPADSPAGIQRPIVGFLGTLSSRIELRWVRAAVEALPEISWLFVGNIERYEVASADVSTLRWLAYHPRCFFTGRLPHRRLIEYAAAVDVAAMPYSNRSVNARGSPTRLFLQLPFGQPIVASEGCEQMREFEDVVALVGDAESFVEAIRSATRASGGDGKSSARWNRSLDNTWEVRARALATFIRSAANTAAP